MGDVALAASESARREHCHPVEDVMGLDERIARAIDDRADGMFDDIVMEGVSEYGNTGIASRAMAEVGRSIPEGLYAIRIDLSYSTANTDASVDVVIGGNELVYQKRPPRQLITTISLVEGTVFGSDNTSASRIMFVSNYKADVAYSIRMRRLFH